MADRNEFLKDVLAAVVEDYGYAQWRQVYEWSYDEGSNSPSAHIDEIGDGDEEPVRHHVTLQTLSIGLGRIANPNFQIRSDLRAIIHQATVESDAGNIDAEAADVILQAGLFDEIRYG